jgi:hypothetical protein
LVCRVFGVAASTIQHGKLRFSTCSILKEKYSTAILDKFSDAPMIETWKRKLESIAPQLSEKEIPINQALSVILEKILLLHSFK